MPRPKVSDILDLISISHSSQARVRNVENCPSMGQFSTRTASTATYRVSALRGAPKRSLRSRFARAILARTPGYLTPRKRCEITRLSVPERIELVQEIWDSIAAIPEEVPLSEAQKNEIDTRAAKMRADPKSGNLWEKVKSNLRL